MADFLLELRSEEIPARMQAKARNDLARLFAEELEEAGIASEAIETFSTPRRLVLIVRGLPLETPSVRVETKGPRVGAPEQALAGFMQKYGLEQGQLIERDGVYFAERLAAGRPTTNVLAFAVQRIVERFPWPKSMRWGDGDLKWVRPLHGIVALLGEEIVPVEIGGIESGATTIGHRFHHPGPITIGGADDYMEKLRACHVIVDQDDRERLIRDGADAAAREAGLTLLPDEGLVVENAGLTEWPVPLLGRFDPEYLDVPREVIVLTMRTNQKYFACAGEDGLLAPAFVCVANIAAKDDGESIVEGNRRVLAARLADARFFWEQDLKVPLEEQAKKLGGIVFHEKLGTVADKVERVAKLARWLVEEGVVKGADADQVERAARLAKADLVTGMVGEFPELQGVIGGYLAAAQGEPAAVADAIRDHYKPVGQGDEVPTAPVTVAVSLADKLDSLFAFFAVNLLPTGSRDPFALRRSALGSMRLIESAGLRFLVSEAAREWNKDDTTGPGLAVEHFLHDRLGVQMRDEGIRYDFVQASTQLETKLDGDVWRVRRRAAALQEFLETEDGTNLLSAYKRAANILKKEEGSWTPDQVRGDDIAGEEAALAFALDVAEPKASAAIEAEDFTGAMAALALLREPIDTFFKHVTVNDPDRAKRTRRLSLLARFRDAVNRVADFSKIEG